MARKATVEQRLMRCAIYTRKSAAVGLDKPLNSLETQRGVCHAYIQSQAHRNWVEIPQHYDDGGYSGGTLARPALQQLITDIEAGRVDIVVIYKVDRLSRSLTDFVRLMDVLDKYGASFVSVTQTFDTSDSMGRLILNILLTFAQFERELASERIRDRCAARRRKGLFAGGMPPIGYIVRKGGKLVPDPGRADIIRNLFLDFPEASAAELGRRLEQQNFRTLTFGFRHGRRDGHQKFPATNVLKILRNPLYAGYFQHNGQLVQSQIEPLVSLEQWQQVQKIIRTRHPCVRDPVNNFLLGILHDELGRRMRTAKGSGGQKKARYYWSEAVGWARGYGVKKVHVNAEQIERLTVSTIEAFLTDRTRLREAVLSLGLYSKETSVLLSRGRLAARRLSLMDNPQLREFLVAVVACADVSRPGLRLLICIYELTRFLAWDGTGLFRKAPVRPKGADRFRMLYAPACLICTRPEYAIPIRPRVESSSMPDGRLVQLLHDAAELQQFMLGNRTKSLRELAAERKMGSKYFARLLRVNYLAPDIQAAIMDGTQPPDLTVSRIVFSPLPTDWEQQRRLFGFPSQNP
jgi:site-specific DNA recombinase